MKTKLVRPVLIPINDIDAKLTLYHDGKFNNCILPEYVYELQSHTNQQLVLISLEDENIEVGDTFVEDTRDRIDENNGIPVWKLHKCTSIVNGWIHGDNEEGVGYNPNWSKRVIATQDQLSPEYIQQFVDQYNNGIVEDCFWPM